MNVIGTARAIGLDVTNGEMTGTIDEKNVFAAIAELAEGDPDNRDLFDEATARVLASRSAGLEQLPADRMRAHSSRAEVATTQLRYCAEMTAIFTDLAIDVGLRSQRDSQRDLVSAV